MDQELAGIVVEFLVEAREHLDGFEHALLEVERDPRSEDAIARLFRAIHSIKGSCGFLGFQKLESVAHAGETVLARARDGHLRLEGDVISALLALVDVIARLLHSIEERGHEDGLQVDEVLALFERILETRAARSDGTTMRGSSGDRARPRILLESRIRVDVTVLDRLMNLVGELVLARNQVAQQSTSGALSMVAPLQRLNLVTKELQEVVMKARMQPVQHVFSRFPRMVRDLALASGKEVRLMLEGGDTELDRTILEAIFDPLTHIVRNAIDHGIETIERRRERGKSAVGTLTLRAFHEGGMVNLEISDDGAGIDVERIKLRAIEQHLAPAERVHRMSGADALELLFLPGFSTSERVTTVSGRGVGMDVVRTNVERCGGAVEIHSELGSGTTVRLKIPLTLAIIPALIVESRGESYAIPQASLLEVVRIDTTDGQRRLEQVGGAAVLRLRGTLLPILDLACELDGKSALGLRESITVVVLRADQGKFGLVVDGIRDTEEIVVKPLWKRLKHLTIYAGATVMGDGRVALILDAMGLAQRIGFSSEALSQATSQDVQGAADLESQREELHLVCRIGSDGRLAIPLTRVARLEEFSPKDVELVGGRGFIQHRNGILPLAHASQVVVERRRRPRGAPMARPSSASLHVVVCRQREQPLGLIVDEILDIVSVRVALERLRRRPGVLGTMIVAGRITEFLDVDAALSGDIQPSELLAGAAE